MKIHNNTGKEILYPEIQILTLDKSQRLTEALKAFGILFGLAVGSILIPVLHFVLVPTFLILSPVFAWINYKKTFKIQASNLTCPECKGKIDINATSSSLPIRSSCKICGVGLYIE